MNDSEFEVKLAAINNIAESLKYISVDKIVNLLLSTIQNVYPEGTPPFRAGVASALSEMADFVGKDYTQSKIMPIMRDLIQD